MITIKSCQILNISFVIFKLNIYYITKKKLQSQDKNIKPPSLRILLYIKTVNLQESTRLIKSLRWK